MNCDFWCHFVGTGMRAPLKVTRSLSLLREKIKGGKKVMVIGGVISSEREIARRSQRGPQVGNRQVYGAVRL